MYLPLSKINSNRINDGLNSSYFLKQLESPESRKLNNIHLRLARIFWQLLLAPWRLLFAFVPPYQIAHGWIAFICSLLFISGIAYIVTDLTDLISCVTGLFSLPEKICSIVPIGYHVNFPFSYSMFCSRYKCLCHSIYSTGSWNFMARFSSK